MTVATLALVVVVLVALSLALVVRGLNRQVSRLSGEVEGLREMLAVREAPPPPPTVAEQPRPAVEVPVITALSAETADEPLPSPTTGRVVSVTLAGPLLKAVAFGSGVRRALDDEHRMRVAYAYRKELKRQRRLRRRAAAARARHPEGRLS